MLNEHFVKTEKQLSEIKQEVRVMKNDIEHLKRDVGFLHDWNLWLLMAAVTLLALPQIVAGIKALFGAFAEGISLVMKALRKEEKV